MKVEKKKKKNIYIYIYRERERKRERESKIPTVKTPPIIAQTFVRKCENDFGFSVIKT